MVTLLGCCKSELIREDRLTEYEKSLIPYESFSSINFVDNHGNRVSATSEFKELEIMTYQEEEQCDYETYEYLSVNIRFEYNDLVLQISIASFNDIVELGILSLKPAPPGHIHYSLSCIGDHSRPIENKLTDISILGFDYYSVFVFVDCDQGSEISKIIYSPEKGIELIEFETGDYIKLE